MTLRLANIAFTIAALMHCGTFAAAARPLAQAKQFWVGRIDISGNTRTKEEVVRRMIPLDDGDLFNQSLWDLGIARINASGLFEPVLPADVKQILDLVNGIVNIELHLKERDHRRIDVSGGGGTTGGASASLDYSDINLSGRADRATARARLGTRELSVGGNYSAMLLTKRPVTIDLGGFYQRLKYVQTDLDNRQQPLFLQSSAGASAGVFYSLTKSRYAFSTPTRVGLLYSFSSTNLRDSFLVNNSTERQITETGQRLASLTAIFEHNTLDRSFDPDSGERFVSSLEVAARGLGGNINTLRPLLDFRKFFPQARQDTSRPPRVIGVRARASYVASFGDRFGASTLSTVDGVPIFKRSFTGGEEEVRGYDVNSIAPLARIDRLLLNTDGTTTLIASDVRPVGGDTELIFNAEYRVPIIWQLSAAAFFDAGGSFNLRTLREESFQSANLVTVLRPLTNPEEKLPNYRFSLGGEIRFPIPVVNIPLRLIFAYNPNAQRALPGSLLAPEHKFAFRFGFSRTL